MKLISMMKLHHQLTKLQFLNKWTQYQMNQLTAELLQTQIPAMKALEAYKLIQLVTFQANSKDYIHDTINWAAKYLNLFFNKQVVCLKSSRCLCAKRGLRLPMAENFFTNFIIHHFKNGSPRDSSM